MLIFLLLALLFSLIFILDLIFSELLNLEVYVWKEKSKAQANSTFMSQMQIVNVTIFTFFPHS